MKDLNLIDHEEQRSFFSSFDYVFTDIGGVLWFNLEPIDGAKEAIKCLQKLGKTVVGVSNNTTRSIETYDEELRAAGFNIGRNNLITPALTMVAYLNKINFDQKLYVLGMNPLKKILSNAGFQLVNSVFNQHVDSVKDVALATILGDDDVGAIISDFDLNVNYIALQRACGYLKRKKMLFLAGAPDTKCPLGPNHVLLGSGYFHNILEDMTGKKPVVLAKPSQHLGRYLIEKFKVPDESRVLVIGDSIAEDMGFATNSGFQKLLVLTGLSKRRDVFNWSYPEAYKPDYFVDSLATVHSIIKQIF